MQTLWKQVFFKPYHSSDQVSKRFNVDAISIFLIVMRVLIWYFEMAVFFLNSHNGTVYTTKILFFHIKFSLSCDRFFFDRL